LDCEKFGRAKIAAARHKAGEMGLVQAFEVLSWHHGETAFMASTLRDTWILRHLLKGVDLGQLEERAIGQVERVELKRLEAARAAFLR